MPSPANQPAPKERSGESIDSILAKNLTVARAIGRITQQELSARSGISRATIAQLESGYSDPRLSTLVLLAKAMEVPPLFLLIGELEAQALAELAKRRTAEPRLDIPPADLKKMHMLVGTGMLKDRLRAARLAAAVAERVRGARQRAFTATAVFSAILPGEGTIVGHLLDVLLDSPAGPSGESK